MDIIKMFKEDIATAGVILFWAIIFSIIPLTFLLIISVEWQAILFIFCIEFFILSNFVSSFRKISLFSKVIKQIVFFTFGSIVSFISISAPFGYSSEAILENEFIIIMLFIIGMLLPYIFFGFLTLSKKYSDRIIKNIGVIKLSLSFMIAIVTVQYAFTPYFVADQSLVHVSNMVTLFPFAINVLLLCIIEYLRLSKTF